MSVRGLGVALSRVDCDYRLAGRLPKAQKSYVSEVAILSGWEPIRDFGGAEC